MYVYIYWQLCDNRARLMQNAKLFAPKMATEKLVTALLALYKQKIECGNAISRANVSLMAMPRVTCRRRPVNEILPQLVYRALANLNGTAPPKK